MRSEYISMANGPDCATLPSSVWPNVPTPQLISVGVQVNVDIWNAVDMSTYMPTPMLVIPTASGPVSSVAATGDAPSAIAAGAPTAAAAPMPALRRKSRLFMQTLQVSVKKTNLPEVWRPNLKPSP